MASLAFERLSASLFGNDVSGKTIHASGTSFTTKYINKEMLAIPGKMKSFKVMWCPHW